MNFESFKLHPYLSRGIADQGFLEPTPIQQKGIGPILRGSDVLGTAMTGSGKTAAFALPILHRLLDKPRRTTRALVLSPTRELAAEVADWLDGTAPWRVVADMDFSKMPDGEPDGWVSINGGRWRVKDGLLRPDEVHEMLGDILILDTAGRLHTKKDLMQQLTKIRDVVARKIPDAPNEVLLVLDATTGQNAISQAKLFTEAINVTGIFLAKLDGTAKGGRRHSIGGDSHRRGVLIGAEHHRRRSDGPDRVDTGGIGRRVRPRRIRLARHSAAGGLG